MLRNRPLIVIRWLWLVLGTASTVIAPVLGTATWWFALGRRFPLAGRLTLSDDHALGLEIGPWPTPINRRHPQLHHRRQRVTTDASNSGNTLSIDQDRRTFFQDRLHCQGGTVGELIIRDSEVGGQVARSELTQVRRDLLNIETAAAAPAERAIKIKRPHPRFAHLRITGQV
jgi:hypothetical protein